MTTFKNSHAHVLLLLCAKPYNIDLYALVSENFLLEAVLPPYTCLSAYATDRPHQHLKPLCQSAAATSRERPAFLHATAARDP